LSRPTSTFDALPDAFGGRPVVMSMVAPGSTYVDAAMLNGVRPAMTPFAGRTERDTIGNPTEKLGPLPSPWIVQVCAVMLPLTVIVPSAANAADTMLIAAATATYASECAVSFCSLSTKSSN
jgi:hypothetical protein